MLEAILSFGCAPLRDIVTRSHLEAEAANNALEELVRSGLILFLEDDLVISKGLWDQTTARLLQGVQNYHKTYPLRVGIPREELKSRVKDITKVSPRLFNAAVRKLVSEEALKESGPVVFHPDHAIRFNSVQQQNIDRLLEHFASSPYAPPTVKECQSEVGDEVTSALIETGQLVIVAPEVVFRKEDYEQMVADIRQMINENGTLTVAKARDHFNTSRRYVLAFLEHLDSLGITTRDGDARRLKSL
jgi:selenocysteine-specific elongation factor